MRQLRKIENESLISSFPTELIQTAHAGRYIKRIKFNVKLVRRKCSHVPGLSSPCTQAQFSSLSAIMQCTAGSRSTVQHLPLAWSTVVTIIWGVSRDQTKRPQQCHCNFLCNHAISRNQEKISDFVLIQFPGCWVERYLASSQVGQLCWSRSISLRRASLLLAWSCVQQMPACLALHRSQTRILGTKCALLQFPHFFSSLSRR